MSNMDISDECSIRAEQQGESGNNEWNYVKLLVPMLSLAAYRYTWLKSSQREIKQITLKYDEMMNTITMKLEQQKLEHKETTKLKLELERKVEALNEKKDQERVVSVALKEVEDRLMERQWAYCSTMVTRLRRREIENELLTKTAKNPVFAPLEMEKDLKEIFEHDFSCAEYLNKDGRRNGRLMWLYLKDWKRKLGVDF